MATVVDAFAQARKHLQGGEFMAAESCCQSILRVQAGDTNAWFLLGRAYWGQRRLPDAVACWQQTVRLRPDYGEAQHLLAVALGDLGRHEEALEHHRNAVRLQPDDAEIHFRYSVTLAAAGRMDQAVLALHQALRCRPDFADAHVNLGIALARQGKQKEAVECFRQAIRLDPSLSKAHNNLGVALAELERHDEALNCWREAVRLQPDYAEAHFNIGVTLANGRNFEEAIKAYRNAVRLKPDYAEAYNNLGLALTEVSQYAPAVAVLQHALRLRSNYAEAHNNLALALVELGRYEEALADFQEALRINPNYPEALNNLGTALAAVARTDEALAVYELALWQRADYAEVHWNRALAFLQTGNYQEGWREYDWRWKRKRARPRQLPQKPWAGGPLEGKTILLWAEQGLGDTIQFIRLAALVKARGPTVIFESPPELAALVASCPGIDRIVPEKEPLPEFDVHAPLLSLPNLLGITLATVPAQAPYLSAPEDQVQSWRQQVGANGDLRVGLAWQGNPKHRWDRHRSIPLTEFAPLAEVKGVRFYRLQKGPGAEQAEALADRFPLVDFGARFDGEGVTFLDTAALVKSLDLVITCDSAVGHLAGAVGVPVWVALATLVDWRWMYKRSDTPWYPTMRLFRQERPGEWGPVIRKMAGELATLAAGARSP